MAVSIFLLIIPTNTHAQEGMGGGIATMYMVIGSTTPQTGDIVSFDRHSQTFHLSHIPGDKDAFGVVAKNPILLLSSVSNGTPIVTSGEMSVNVTTKNGPIYVGDNIAPSSITGKGAKAIDSDPYIIGTALSSFSGTASGTASRAEGVQNGSVKMLFLHKVNPLASVSQNIPQSVKIGKNIIFHIIKYILATLVAIGTVYAAFKVSNSSMKAGLISIGRNPLAKTPIHSMLVVNAIMVILISVVGLVAALALVFLPV